MMNPGCWTVAHAMANIRLRGARSVEAHIGRRYDFRPFRPIGLEPRPNFRADDAGRRRIHRTQSLNDIG